MSPTIATTGVLREIVGRKTAMLLVWPDEGQCGAAGWEFNADHEAQGFEPLWVDMQTANAMLIVRDALKAENRAKFDRMVNRHRGEFGRLVEFAWAGVRRAGRTGT